MDATETYMTSLLTNTSAMSVLRVLAGTQKSLAATETQVSTGLRVADASDDAAYWSAAVSMKARAATVSAVNAGLDLAQDILDVAAVGMKQAISTMTDIKKLVVSARSTGADRTAIQTQIDADTASMMKAIGSASFDGVNLLQTNANALVFGQGTTRQATDAHVTVQTSVSGDTLDLTLPVALLGYLHSDAGVQTYGILDTTNPDNEVQGSSVANYGQWGLYPSNGGTGTYSGWQGDYIRIDRINATAASGSPDIAQTIDQVVAGDTRLVDGTLAAMTNLAAVIGGKQTQLRTQQAFNAALSDALTSGIGSLVDADMNVASTRLQALQTKQRLGIQALSIANDNSKAVLKLFG